MAHTAQHSQLPQHRASRVASRPPVPSSPPGPRPVVNFTPAGCAPYVLTALHAALSCRLWTAPLHRTSARHTGRTARLTPGRSTRRVVGGCSAGQRRGAAGAARTLPAALGAALPHHAADAGNAVCCRRRPTYRPTHRTTYRRSLRSTCSTKGCLRSGSCLWRRRGLRTERRCAARTRPCTQCCPRWAGRGGHTRMRRPPLRDRLPRPVLLRVWAVESRRRQWRHRRAGRVL